METALSETLGKSDLMKLANVGLCLRDFLFLRKLSGILFCLDSISAEERDQWLAKLGEDKNQKKRLMENVVLSIDRLDDVEKATLFGKFFSAHISGQIDYETFRRLTTALDRVALVDLPVLRLFCAQRDKGPEFYESYSDSLQNLAICGLAGISDASGLWRKSLSQYEQNALGEQFTALAFG